MENINEILDRIKVEEDFVQSLNDFQDNKLDPLIKRCVYISGNIGSGKTKFVIDTLNHFQYDIIQYDSSELKNNIDNIVSHSLSSYNISTFLQNANKKKERIAIVVHDLDYITSMDKVAITSLIKLVRPKRTKKQKNEPLTFNPIICIGSSILDKKIKELVKVSSHIHLPSPTHAQIESILDLNTVIPENAKAGLIKYINNDLRKLNDIVEFFQYKKNGNNNLNFTSFFKNAYNTDTKDIARELINNEYAFKDHGHLINETDRTIVGLLWHENIINAFANVSVKLSLPLYVSLLKNICFADFIDRITFQYQIWSFNEMTSLLKVFKNNMILHKSNVLLTPVADVQFTKILTKYSTEYNNALFYQNLCYRLLLDMKDVHSTFIQMKDNPEELQVFCEEYDVGKLDSARIYRYFEKYTSLYKEPKGNCKEVEEDEVGEEETGA